MVVAGALVAVLVSRLAPCQVLSVAAVVMLQNVQYKLKAGAVQTLLLLIAPCVAHVVGH